MRIKILQHKVVPKEIKLNRDHILVRNGTRCAGWYTYVCGECGDLYYLAGGKLVHMGLIAKRVKSPMYWGFPW